MLIKVVNKETGCATSMYLDGEWTLKQVRSRLAHQSLMQENEFFLNEGTCIFQEDEENLLLQELLQGGREFWIGKHGDIDRSLDVSDFTGLSNDMILDFFKKKQLCNGLVFSAQKGIRKSFFNTFELTKVPQMLVEPQNTYFHSSYSFSKESRDLSLITSNKGSLSLNTPFVDTSAEFSKRQEEKAHSETVTEFLLSKLIISLMSFHIDPVTCLPTRDFALKMHDIVTQKIEKERKVLLILEVLDEYGLYIPTEFTMGGALYATETTEVKEYSSAAGEKTDFSAKASATFNGNSGGASYDTSSESTQGQSSSSKYKVIEVKQIGGEPGDTVTKEIFFASLKTLSKWEIVDIQAFYPSVLLLMHANQIEGVDPMLFIKVKNLLTDFSMHKFFREHQPYIDMLRYVNTLNGYLAPL